VYHFASSKETLGVISCAENTIIISYSRLAQRKGHGLKKVAYKQQKTDIRSQGGYPCNDNW
jgi:hypothetical protein